MGREVHCSFPAVSVHPAKLVWGLARWLLAHVKAEGWVSPVAWSSIPWRGVR